MSKRVCEMSDEVIGDLSDTKSVRSLVSYEEDDLTW